jgi:CDP-paratose 2-epimerase
MTWLVTGGCGFVGSNLADSLLGSGEDVVLLDNLSRYGSAHNLAWLRERHGEDWRFVQADTRDTIAVDAVIGEVKPHTVAHLAGQVAMTTSVADPRADFETNALGTFNVLDAVRRLSPESGIIYSSTNKVYGELDQFDYVEGETRWILPSHPNGLSEDLQLDGYSPYGCSKLAADQYVRDWHRMYGLRTTVFRHSSMYGGRQFATYDQGWIGWFCMKALEMADPAAPSFTISGDGKQVRDALHSDDLVSAYLAAAEHLDEVAGTVFNIGGGQANSLSLLELFAKLEALTGNAMRYEKLPLRQGDQLVFVADVTRARELLGWEPRVSSDEGLARMIDWTREMTVGA